MTDAATVQQRPQQLAQQLQSLDTAFLQQTQRTLAGWDTDLKRPEYRTSAENLAYYLALRSHDLREL